MATSDTSTSSIFNIENVKQELEDNGVAVVPNVFSIEDCDEAMEQYRIWLRQYGDSFPKNVFSILLADGVSHASATWKIRQKCKPLFSELWGTEKLLSSMDSIAIGRPPEDGATKFEEDSKHSLHIDQYGEKIGLHAYQGAAYLEEATEEDYCFMVIEDSHKRHKEFFDQKKAQKNEFRRLSDREVIWFAERGCKVKRIACPKGGFILWDSRTVHAGAPPKRNRIHTDRWRFVVFVCMGPAIWASEKDLAVKKEAYDEMFTTVHWPTQGSKINHRLGKKKKKIMPDNAKTDEAKQLVGLIPYDFDDGKPNGPDWKPAFKEILDDADEAPSDCKKSKLQEDRTKLLKDKHQTRKARGQNQGQFNCPRCPRVCASRGGLVRHLKSHK